MIFVSLEFVFHNITPLTKSELVVLVDKDDTEIGVGEKMETHLNGKLHRAISVFIFNSAGKWLLHKRAANKYHSSGLWTNACCSHPKPGEENSVAAHRRLKEEMGLECELKHAFHFIYRAELDNNLIEHELDHVFIGTTDSIPVPDAEEVSEWHYFSAEEIEAGIYKSPQDFTEWFKIVFDQVRETK
mgnify:CR=1 FL=1